MPKTCAVLRCISKSRALSFHFTGEQNSGRNAEFKRWTYYIIWYVLILNQHSINFILGVPLYLFLFMGKYMDLQLHACIYLRTVVAQAMTFLNCYLVHILLSLCSIRHHILRLRMWDSCYCQRRACSQVHKCSWLVFHCTISVYYNWRCWNLVGRHIWELKVQNLYNE